MGLDKKVLLAAATLAASTPSIANAQVTIDDAYRFVQGEQNRFPFFNTFYFNDNGDFAFDTRANLPGPSPLLPYSNLLVDGQNGYELQRFEPAIGLNGQNGFDPTQGSNLFNSFSVSGLDDSSKVFFNGVYMQNGVPGEFGMYGANFGEAPTLNAVFDYDGPFPQNGSSVITSPSGAQYTFSDSAPNGHWSILQLQPSGFADVVLAAPDFSTNLANFDSANMRLANDNTFVLSLSEFPGPDALYRYHDGLFEKITDEAGIHGSFTNVDGEDIFPDINSSGHIVFTATEGQGSEELWLYNDSGLQQLVSTDGADFDNILSAQINDSGTIAYMARDFDDLSLHVSGFDDPLLYTGMDLFGHTLVDFSLAENSLNNNGQLGFNYVLSNGGQGYAIMNNVPSPGGAALMGLAGLVAARRKR